MILWRRGGQGRRTVEFEAGVVNVISGASKTGKSAVIPIIDYCLGADRCAIPVGVIRESCEWFGVLVETIEGQKLLARREPGEQQQTGDMFVLEGENIEVPERIDERNSNVGIVKTLLDRVSGLSNLGFEPDADTGYRARPSFRDLMAFTFQPQNVVANPDVLFFKADTTEHREKLKTIFPYVLNALAAKDLATRWEIDRLEKLLRRKESELNVSQGAMTVWQSEASAWIRQAVELGLVPPQTTPPQEWIDVLALLRKISEGDSRRSRPTMKSIEAPLRRLQELRQKEANAAEKVSQHRQRLNELLRLIQNSDDFGAAMRVQRDRLAIAKWVRDRADQYRDARALGGADPQDELNELVTTLEAIELQLASHPAISDRLEKEQLRLRAETEKALEQLNVVRREIATLERASKAAREAAYSLDRVERFLGRLQQALTLYDRTGQNATLRQELSDLRKQLEEIRKNISEADIKRRVDNAIVSIERSIGAIAPSLGAEWPDAAVKLLPADLTLKVVRGTRDDYLWEIGSGANWLAYHIATTLALQRFFLESPHHPVPGLLVYDQPSQVYFPRRAAGDATADPDWTDEDVVAVRKIFAVVASEVARSNGRLQVIVLDHADDDVWGSVNGVHLVEEWRGKKLVPDTWVGDR